MGIKALTGGWANYERKQLQMPPEDCRTSGSANMWIWVVDYELAAHKLQMELYGQSNIVIAEDRVSIIDVYRGANYTGSSDSNNSNSSDKVVVTTQPVTETQPVQNNEVTEENTVTTEEYSDDINDIPDDEIEDLPDDLPGEESTVPVTQEPVTEPTEEPTEVLV